MRILHVRICQDFYERLELGLVPEPCYYLSLLAVRQNGLALEYVPDEMQSYEMCVEAVRQDSKAFRHIKIVNADIMKACVRIDPSLLEAIHVSSTGRALSLLSNNQFFDFHPETIFISALLYKFSSLLHIHSISPSLYKRIRSLVTYDAKIAWSHKPFQEYLYAEIEGPVIGTSDKISW